MKLPTVSIVVVNLNGIEWLKKFIPSILETDYPKNLMEIIFVDNGSADNSIKFIEKSFPKKYDVKIIKNRKNLGWSPANNQGMFSSNGEIIICISNDMEMDTQWIKELVKVIQSDPKIGIVQCNSISMWDRKTLDSSMNYLDRYGLGYGYTPKEKPIEVFFSEGMAFAIRRETFNATKGFDDYYFMEYDDMDLSWRARLMGYKVFFSPSSIVYHARGGTVGSTYVHREKNIRWYTKNHIVTLVKNYETKNLIIALPVVLATEIGKMLYLTIRGKRNLSKATLDGIIQSIKDYKLIMKKRIEVQKSRKVPDKEIMKVMHPFRPAIILRSIQSKMKGENFIMNSKPPIKCYYE